MINKPDTSGLDPAIHMSAEDSRVFGPSDRFQIHNYTNFAGDMDDRVKPGNDQELMQLNWIAP